MINISEFLTTILKKILKKPIVSDEYNSDYHISRNTFSYYIKNNSPLSKTIIEVLEQIILKEISNNEEKKKKLLEYLKTFLSDDEKSTNDPCKIIKIVLSKITSNCNSKKNKSIDPLCKKYIKKFKIFSFYDIQEMELDIKNLITEAMRLDSEIFDDIPEEHEGTLDQWFGLGNEYPETWRYLFDENDKIIGYWSFKPLFDSAFQKAKEGLIFDGELNLNMMPVFVPGTYNIYFVEICLSNQHKGTSILRLLLNSITEALENLAHNDIFINEICTQAYTLDGIRLCKSLGLKYHKDHVDCGEIYCGNIKGLLEQPFCRNAKTLKALYAKRFNK